MLLLTLAWVLIPFSKYLVGNNSKLCVQVFSRLKKLWNIFRWTKPPICVRMTLCLQFYSRRKLLKLSLFDMLIINLIDNTSIWSWVLLVIPNPRNRQMYNLQVTYLYDHIIYALTEVRLQRSLSYYIALFTRLQQREINVFVISIISVCTINPPPKHLR